MQPPLSPPRGPADITGIVLAGGQAQRMGGHDKGLLLLAGRPLVAYCLDRFKPQVSGVLISANRNAETYAALGASVVADDRPGFPGPLGGIATALRLTATPWIAIVPCDAPFLPIDFVRRLACSAQDRQADIVCAKGQGRLQPVFALLHRNLLSSLDMCLDIGERKLETWYRRHRLATVDFSDTPDMFININTPQELTAAEKVILHESP